MSDQPGDRESLILRIVGAVVLAVIVVGGVLLEQAGRETDRIFTWVGSVIVPALLVIVVIDRQKAVRVTTEQVKQQVSEVAVTAASLAETTEQVAASTEQVKVQTNGRMTAMRAELDAIKALVPALLTATPAPPVRADTSTEIVGDTPHNV